MGMMCYTVNMPSNRGVESIGKGIFEDPCKVWVAHSAFHIFNDAIHGWRCKGSAIRMGALEWQSEWTIAKWPAGRESATRLICAKQIEILKLTVYGLHIPRSQDRLLV